MRLFLLTAFWLSSSAFAADKCFSVPDLSNRKICDLQVKNSWGAHWVEITCDGALVYQTEACREKDDGGMGAPGSLPKEMLMTASLHFMTAQNFEILKIDTFNHALLRKK